MICRRQEVRVINATRGNPHDIISDVQGDGLYNNPLHCVWYRKNSITARKQVCYLQAENVTPKHEIIALTIRNKLCSYHKQHQLDELNMTNKTCDCITNISMETNIDDEGFLGHRKSFQPNKL